MKNKKMVAIALRFWTNEMELRLGKKEPKKLVTTCWDSGMAQIEENQSKGIRKAKPQPFNCFEDIIPLIKELFRKNGVFVVSANRLPRVLSHRRKNK